MMLKRTSLLLFCGILLTVVLLTFSGCGSSSSAGSDESSGGVITGKVPAGSFASIVARSASGEDVEIPVDAEGGFAGRVAAGRYQLLTKTADGKLSLVKISIIVEDRLTVSLLETAMVPQPGVLAVSVPLVYADSAMVEWETDIESDGRIDYGLDEKYGYSTYTDTEMKSRHRIQLFGLTPGTRYHFRIVAGRYGLDSVQSFSGDYSFVTERRENASGSLFSIYR
ncbi:MAG: fibronectin type III domain-containing protein [Candidatus Ozemobacteraceae bacterium]